MISKNEYTQKCNEIKSRYIYTGSITGPNDYVLHNYRNSICESTSYRKLYDTAPKIGRNEIKVKKRHKKNKESRKQRKINRRLKR